jgi:spore maturation protein CgeB
VKILFVSNHNPCFANTNVYREKTIEELGHQVIFFDDRDFLLPGRIRQQVDFLQNWDMKRLNKKLIGVASNEKPDLCLMVGGYRTLSETLLHLRNIGSKMVLWTTDPPRDFGHVIRTASLYDYVFCAGTEAIEILKQNGLKNPIWLPFACDPDYHRPIELTRGEKKRYAKDVVFVGGYSSNRWQTLKELKEFNIGVWGPYWNKAANGYGAKQYVKDANLNYTEWVKIYNASKIVIVIHYQDGQTPCYQASPKVFEALACRSFVLVDRQKDVFSLFDDKRHLVGFDNREDLKEKIKYYLDHPREREEIARQGYQEVLTKHTYTHRINKMFSEINISG